MRQEKEIIQATRELVNEIEGRDKFLVNLEKQLKVQDKYIFTLEAENKKLQEKNAEYIDRIRRYTEFQLKVKNLINCMAYGYEYNPDLLGEIWEECK